MKLQLFTRNKIITIIVLLILALGIILTLLFIQSKQVNKSSGLVTHTYDVLFTSEKILSNTLEMESSVRGFVITAQKEFVDNIHYANGELRNYLTLLRKSTSENLIQKRNIDTLEILIAQKINFTDQVLNYAKSGNTKEAQSKIESGIGRKIYLKISKQISIIQTEEFNLLHERKTQAEDAVKLQTIILLAALIAVILLIGFIIKMIWEDAIEKRKLASELKSLNEDLEKRIIERTNELVKTNMQLEQTFLRITDGVLALDSEWRYTFANQRLCEMIRKSPEELLGKSVWDIFPDAVDSLTYETITQAYATQKYRWNEDYYAPLQLWQENHVYPSAEGVTVFIRDISERKRFESELKEINQRYEYVMKATSDAIWDWDIENNYIIWGEGFQSIFGFNISELGHNIEEWDNHIHPDDRERVIEKISRDIANETTNNWIDEYKFRKANGQYALVVDRAVMIRNKNGKVIRMIGAMQDITESKKQELLLENAIHISRIGSWEIDMINNKVYFSSMTKLIHEVEEDYEPTIEKGINFYKEEYKPIITAAINNAIEKNESWDLEMQIITAKGRELWIRGIGEAEVINGKCVRLFGSFQDIDKLKRTQIGLAEIVEEKSNILESIGDGFFSVNEDWEVTYWNNHMEKLFNTDRAKIIGTKLDNQIKDRDVFQKLNEAKIHQSVTQVEYQTNDNWFELNAYPTSKRGLSVYFRDVTDRKLAELKLKELYEALEKHAKELTISNKELEQFAYVASHDLQEPLRMVTSFLTQLEKKYGDVLDDKAKQYIFFAVDGAKRMRQIILDLLEFSRVGRSEDKIEKVDLNEIVHDVEILLSKKIEQSKATIQYTNLPIIATFRSPVRQVFQNLIGNGIKYHHKDIPPVINITFTEKEHFWEFSIKDNGIGIDPQYFEKIFKIFQRLHNRDEYSGTGMGLAISKKIIEYLGGQIWVSSKEGEGSTFYFTIPKSI